MRDNVSACKKIINEFDTLLAEKELLIKVYSIFDTLDISTDYEGEIRMQGDAVLSYDEMVIIDNSIDLQDHNYDALIRILYNGINWVDIKFFACTIVNHKLLWGVK